MPFQFDEVSRAELEPLLGKKRLPTLERLVEWGIKSQATPALTRGQKLQEVDKVGSSLKDLKKALSKAQKTLTMLDERVRDRILGGEIRRKNLQSDCT